MNALMIVLRVIHVLSGVYWAGAAFFLVAVLSPTVQEAGPEGGRFMQRLAGGSRMGPRFTIAAILTVLSGIVIYVIRGHWNGLGTPEGIVLAIGALAGLTAFGHGFAVQGRASQRMAALAKEMAARNGPPTPEQMAEAQALGAKLSRGAVTTAVLLIVAVLGMATFEYF
jgi:uncharacterized membrane protein